MGETLRRSALGALRPGDPVNLERAAALGSRLGGHLVQGHVDGVGELISREPAEQWETVRFRLPAALARYVVEKGSITIDGVSLTVAEVGDGLVRGRADPDHAEADHARRASASATRSTWRSTCSPSTSSGCSATGSPAPTAPAVAAASALGQVA